MALSFDLEHLLNKDAEQRFPGEGDPLGVADFSPDQLIRETGVLTFYPPDHLEVDGVVLRRVSPYVMGSRDVLGMVNTYSRRGMILEGITGEEAEKIVAHEVFHALQRPNDEMTTRRFTNTEEPRLSPYTCVRNY